MAEKRAERTGGANARRLVVAFLAAACGACATAAATPAPRLPAPLHRLTLVEEHPQISPVEFDHALHVDERAMGRRVACAECHHTLRDRPGEVPASCVSCHGFAHEAVPVDESKPHDHTLPPDL